MVDTYGTHFFCLALICFNNISAFRFDTYHRQKVDFFRLAKMDVNQAISENIDKANGRVLINKGLIHYLISQKCPEKLKLNVLFEVFTNFCDAIDSDNLFTQSQIFDQRKICFEYDDKVWGGTIDCRHGKYKHGSKVHNVLFTNIKLPNDGFFYTDDYVLPETRTDEIIGTTEVTNIVKSIITRVNPQKTCNHINVNYRPGEGRFEIYLWENFDKCLTVKFEYGTYEWYVNKKSFTFEALEEAVSDIQKDFQKP